MNWKIVELKNYSRQVEYGRREWYAIVFQNCKTEDLMNLENLWKILKLRVSGTSFYFGFHFTKMNTRQMKKGLAE